MPNAAQTGTARLSSNPMANRAVPTRLPSTNNRNTQVDQGSAWLASITARIVGHRPATGNHRQDVKLPLRTAK